MSTSSLNTASSGLSITAGNTIDVVAGGSALSFTIASGGIETVSSGGQDSFVTVFAGGKQFVDGGSATSALVAGEQEVNSGGIAIATTVSGGVAALIVDFSGVASDATVESRGFLSAASGGIAVSTQVASGGVMDVRFGGSAVATNLSSVGIATVEDGGTDSNSFIGAYARQFIDATGSAVSAVVASFGLQVVSGGAVASDSVLSGGTVLVLSGGLLSGTLTFAGAGSELLLDGSATPAAALSGFGSGDIIDFASVTYVSGASATFSRDTNTITVQDGATVLTLNVAGGASYAPGSLLVESDRLGNTELLACFCPGTRIATPAGEVAVEDLCAGDLVMTQHGPLPVRFVGMQTVAARFADPLSAWPVCIRAGALGQGLPARDLRLSPGHALFIHGLLVQAGALVDGVTAVRETVTDDTFQYYHVELDRHALLLAEGVPAESFLDMAEPVRFDNAAARPALPPAAELPYPRVKSARQLPTALRGRRAA